jgi:hypothetical protein
MHKDLLAGALRRHDGRRAGGWLAPCTAHARTGQGEAKVEKASAAHAPGLSIHPYTIALDLGKKIRFSVPIGEIVAELSEKERTARLH